MVYGRRVDPCDEGAVAIGHLVHKYSPQYHPCAFWEDEVIEKVDGTGCLVEYEFLQGGKANPSTRRRGVWLRWIGEGNLDEFE